MNSYSRLLLGVFCGLVVLSGCSKKSDVQSSASAVDASNVEASHPMDMLRVDVGDEIPSLDPQLGQDTTSARVVYDLFAGLVDFDQKNLPIPGLAEKWDVSADGKKITFHLRHDLKFSDGSPLTAKDAVYTFQRIVDPKTASPYNWLLNTVVNGDAIIKGKLPKESLGVLATDDDTFVVNLSNPDPVFIQKCTMPNLLILNSSVIDKFGDKWTNPENIVSSGAYKLKEHIVKGYILAVKNPNYYDVANVSIPAVKYFPYSDTNASLASYKSGGLDITWQNIPVDQYKDIKNQFPAELHTVKQEAIYYYDFNMQSPIFKDNLKLRQALSMAIDRKVITDQVLAQDQVPLYSYVTSTVEGGKYAGIQYEWATTPYDKLLEKARVLFKDSGYDVNHPLTLNISYNTNDMHKKTALAIASMWTSAFGPAIKVKADNQEWKTFIAARIKGDYQVARDGWVADYNSVSTYTQIYQCGGDLDNSKYCNPKFDDLLKQTMISQDEKSRQDLQSRAIRMAMDDYPAIPLFQYTYTKLVKPYVLGYNPDGNTLDHVQTKWMRFSVDKK